MEIKVCILFLVALASAAEAAKILGVFMVPSYSHQLVYQPIWKELSLRGHSVTIYTPNPLNDPSLTNLTEIDLSFSYNVWNSHSNNNFRSISKAEEVKLLFQAFAAVFESQMSSPQMQELMAKMKQEKYDLLLVEYLYPAMYPFKDLCNCPMVGITSLPLTTAGVESLGMVKHPALDPDFILPHATDLSFKERVSSVILYFLGKLSLALNIKPSLNNLAKKYFGENTRDVMAIARDVSLVLGNFNYVTQNIRPNIPAFVEISGIHLRPEKALPQDLKQLLDESKEGVVYFSLGSNVKSSNLPHSKIDMILSAFSELPYKILWKFETDALNDSSILPSNVAIRKWVPQQDVLRHPNIKLFVTQGGLQSIDESLHSKVPMLVIPFFGDQHFNADKMVKIEAGLSLDLNDFTKEELVDKINLIIKNPVYKETVTKLGTKAFDHQVPPLEKAVWWIEYVLRHDGAEHLRYKGADMPFYQFYLLDVLFILSVIVSGIIYGIFKVCKKLVARKGQVSLKKSQ